MLAVHADIKRNEDEQKKIGRNLSIVSECNVMNLSITYRSILPCSLTWKMKKNMLCARCSCDVSRWNWHEGERESEWKRKNVQLNAPNVVRWNTSVFSQLFFFLRFVFAHFAIRASKKKQGKRVRERERERECVCMRKKEWENDTQHEPRMSNRFLSTPKTGDECECECARVSNGQAETNGMVWNEQKQTII